MKKTLLSIIFSLLSHQSFANVTLTYFCQDTAKNLTFIILFSDWTKNEKTGFYATKEVHFIEESKGSKEAKGYVLYSNNNNLESFNLTGLPRSFAPLAKLSFQLNLNSNAHDFLWNSPLSFINYRGQCLIDYQKSNEFIEELDKVTNSY